MSKQQFPCTIECLKINTSIPVNEDGCAGFHEPATHTILIHFKSQDRHIYLKYISHEQTTLTKEEWDYENE